MTAFARNAQQRLYLGKATESVLNLQWWPELPPRRFQAGVVQDIDRHAHKANIPFQWKPALERSAHGE